MPSFHLQNIHMQLPCGRTVFADLNWHHHHHRSALIGQNGVGKSLLADIIAGERSPSSGLVNRPKNMGYFAQSQLDDQTQCTIAQYLAVDTALEALAQVALGRSEQHWFDAIAERWQLNEELSALLCQLRLPCDPQLQLSQLSGGQLATLMLWRLFDQFNHPDSMLILDEPSNHLDQVGKAWLIAHMHRFKGAILLISHDRQLLEHTAHIYELDSLGLHHYSGNYSAYLQQKNAEQQAIERQLNLTRRQHQDRLNIAQQTLQKAQQRASQGQKVQRQGSQPKVMQDFKKNKASAQLSRAAALSQGRIDTLAQKTQALKSRQAEQACDRLYLNQGAQSIKVRTVLRLLACQLPFGDAKPMNICVTTGQKWHIKGNNGAGKSTLFRVLQGQLQAVTGDVYCQKEVMCLDQHATLLQPTLTILAQFQALCAEVELSHARTLLAGIGFKGDKVNQLVATLSGGQKMKLAMLIVSHQASSPLLLLDEPDNHLDLVAKQQLSEALRLYQGTFLLISHDPLFVEASGITDTLHM